MMEISKATRQDIFDFIIHKGIPWWGQIDEVGFLERMFDLTSMHSTDPRFRDARGDIWQHRVSFDDWGDDWIFYDPRFDLLNAEDVVLLRFLCKTIHPEVRSNIEEAKMLYQKYNDSLQHDGYRIVPIAKMAGRPVFSARKIGASSEYFFRTLKEKVGANASYVSIQITRMENALENDPDLVIGTAKDLAETICKDILGKSDIKFSNSDGLPKLVKKTAKLLKLAPSDIPNEAKATKTIKVLLSNLATIADGIAQLRNEYGTGHGKDMNYKGLTSRHARLVVGAASTLAIFFLETYEERINIDKDNGTTN